MKVVNIAEKNHYIELDLYDDKYTSIPKISFGDCNTSMLTFQLKSKGEKLRVWGYDVYFEVNKGEYGEATECEVLDDQNGLVQVKFDYYQLDAEMNTYQIKLVAKHDKSKIYFPKKNLYVEAVIY